MFSATEAMRNHISGVILYDETIRQSSADGTPFPKMLEAKGILPGIKVDTGSKPLALDNEEQRERTLDELSSGTRLQLLLAVRVAFVEQQERGPMLPLILDETLGNSDEHRARAPCCTRLRLCR